MNRLLAAVSVLFCWAIIDTGTVKAQCPEKMISYWELNEDNPVAPGDFVDTIGTNDAICSSNCPDISSQGVVNNSQIFNGINTGIDAPANTAFDFDDSDSFSIELWINRSSGIFSREILIGRDDADTSMQWWLSISASGKAAFTLTSSGGQSKRIEGSKSLDNTKWHHIAFIRDAENNENRLYVDGKIEVSENIIYNSGFYSTAPINIGYLDGGSPDSFFNGSMDEIAIYRRVLTINEIRMHYYLSRGYCNSYDQPRGYRNSSDQPVKIMPLGNSITYDSHSGESRTAGARTGYRWPLWLWLDNANYSVDFVGSEEAGQDVLPAFDYDNAGFPGITADQLAFLLDTGINPNPDPDEMITTGPYLEDYSPDVILLHIGTNGLEPDDTTGVENILDEIDEYSENITVILAKIINRVNYSQDTTTYNNNLETMANNRIANGDKIVLVDMEDGADIIYELTGNDGDMYDNLHPDLVVNPYVVDSGYGKMADVWFASLEDILPRYMKPEDGDSDDSGSGLCFISAINN